MHHLGFTPEQYQAEVIMFYANSNANGECWHTWTRRAGISMIHILCVGGGGPGGCGIVGAASTAAGGGGGGSGSQTSLLIPAHLLPPTLYISVGYGGKGKSSGTPNPGYDSIVAISKSMAAGPGALANHNVAIGKGAIGVTSQNGSGATAGTAGVAGVLPALAMAPLAGLGVPSFLVGQVGGVGGSTGAAAALALPITGLCVTGGTGGGGLASSTGSGSVTFTAVTGLDWTIPASTGTGGNVSAVAGAGQHGCKPRQDLNFYLGGTGGGSAYAATGAFQTGGKGGNGALGCGGGGNGGSFTGATQPLAGDGGDGFVIITAW